jgi:hypothetical protein
VTVAELAQKTVSREFGARHDGECRRCSRPIFAGEDQVVKVDGVSGVFHPWCGRDYCSTINEEVERREAEERDPREPRVRQICREVAGLDAPDQVLEAINRWADELGRAA